MFTLRVSSASAERHHLLISLKRACKAGQSGALWCTLGSYIETVRSQHTILAEKVKQQVYGGAKRTVSQLVRRYESAGTDVNVKRSCRTGGASNSNSFSWTSRPRKRPRTCGYNIFRKQHDWNTVEAGQQWAALDPARRAYYEQLAEEKEEEKNKLCSTALGPTLGSIQPDSQDSNAASHLTPRHHLYTFMAVSNDYHGDDFSSHVGKLASVEEVL